MSATAAVGDFLARVSGVLVRPGETLRRLAERDEARLSDVAILMGARLLAGQGPIGSADESPVLLARALLWLPKGELLASLQGVLRAGFTLLPDAVGVLIASLAVAFFAGRRTAGRELDIGCYAWLPFLVVRLVAALAFTALGRPMSHGESLAADAIATGWALWVLARATAALRSGPSLPTAGSDAGAR